MVEVQDVIPGPAHLAPTAILDHGSAEVQALAAQLRQPGMTPHAQYDISHHVAEDAGFSDTRDQLIASEPKPGRLGRLLFDTLYGGRDIRRIKED